MNNLFAYLLDLNISLAVLFVAYKIFFEKDRNFRVRRVYLMGVIIVTFILPLIPGPFNLPVNGTASLSITLEEIPVIGQGGQHMSGGSVTIGDILTMIYLLFFSLGMIKIFLQLKGIFREIVVSDRMSSRGITVLASSKYHASSFFRYIFIDPETVNNDNFDHILQHEMVHKREWHSIDRIVVELFAMINWFNPAAWMFRKSVIENLEYLADSAVINIGTDPVKYQLSILNQYIGSASVTNLFSSQIKNRINMLNKNYRMGSNWKIALIFPLVFVTFLFISCTEKEPSSIKDGASLKTTAVDDSKIYYEVDETPTFQGGEPVEFRRFIAQNIRYPGDAAENSVTGKIIVKFVVRKNGKVEIPDARELAKLEGIDIDEVVVVAYKPITENVPAAGEEYIEMLKKEAQRVVTTSPDWEPGKVNGKAVDVAFTFPIVFTLQ